MVRMSIMGIWMGRPNSISKLVVKLSLPPTTVETSVEVPPMSRVTRWSTPTLRAICLAPTTPPVGPERVIWMGWRAAASSVISPPLDLIAAMCRVMPFSSSRSRMAPRWWPTTGLM